MKVRRTNKTPLRERKNKKSIKPEQLAYTFRDKKGHPLQLVSARPNSYVGWKRLPFLYCNKCNRFFREQLDKVIVI